MDPRFDERCGHLNLDLFSKSFSFLEDVKKQERAQMETEARKTKDPLKKMKLETCLQKMVSKFLYIHVVYNGLIVPVCTASLI